MANAADDEVRVPTFLEPIQSIEVSTTESGTIRQLLVKPGDEVKKGDLLLKLNSAVIEAQLAQARARAKMTGEIKAAEAEYSLAKSRYDLMKKLQSEGNANQAELDRGLAALTIAEGKFESAKENQEFYELDVARMEAELKRRSIVSPISGVVAEVVRDEAETIGLRLENEEPYLVRIVDLSQFRAEAHVPIRSARRLRQDTVVRFEFRSTEIANPILEGKIEYVSKIADPATGTVQIRALFDAHAEEILSGVSGHLLVP